MDINFCDDCFLIRICCIINCITAFFSCSPPIRHFWSEETLFIFFLFSAAIQGMNQLDVALVSKDL